MSKIVFVVLFIGLCSLSYAAEIQVTDFRDEEIDLIDPQSGAYMETLESKTIATPLKIDREMDNGTYLVTLNGKQVCLDSGSVKTNKVYNIENIRDCKNSIKSNYVAASRGLGKGCIE